MDPLDKFKQNQREGWAHFAPHLTPELLERARENATIAKVSIDFRAPTSP